MKKLINHFLLITSFVFLVCSSSVFAGQNNNSSLFNGGLIFRLNSQAGQEYRYFNIFRDELKSNFKEDDSLSFPYKEPKITSPNYEFASIYLEDGEFAYVIDESGWIKRTGEQSDLNVGKTVNLLQPFGLIGSRVELINTSNITLFWEDTSKNVDIVFQQVFQQASENRWSLVLDDLDPSLSSANVPVEKTTSFVVRKVTKKGQFIDSDGESSFQLLGNTDFQKVVRLDLIPPNWVVIPSLNLLSKNGRDYYVTSINMNEASNVIFTVYDESGGLFYSDETAFQTEEVMHYWATTSSQNLLVDGKFTYELIASDLAGNVSLGVTVSLLLDRQAPHLLSSLNFDNGLFSPNGDGIKDSLAVNVTANELVKFELVLLSTQNNEILKLESNMATSNQFLLHQETVSLLGDGTYDAVLKAVDQKGLKTVLQFPISIDRYPPDVSNLDPIQANSSVINLLYSLTSTEAGLLSVYLDESVSTFNLSDGISTVLLNLSNLEEGEGWVTFSMQDGAGNTSAVTVNTFIDRTAPETITLSIPPTLNYDFESSLFYSVTDNFSQKVLSSFYLDVDGNTHLLNSSIESTGNFLLSNLVKSNFPSLESGEYTVRVLLEDVLKNQRVVTQSTIIRSADPSFIVSELPKYSFLVNPEITLSLLIQQGRINYAKDLDVSLWNISKLGDVYTSENVKLGDISFKWDGEINDVLTSFGLYELEYLVTDIFGKQVSFRQPIYIDHKLPVIKKLDLKNDHFNYTDPLLISFEVEDDSLELDRAELHYKDRLLLNEDFSKNNSLNLAFDGLLESSRFDDGEHELFLSVYDSAGNTTTSSVVLTVDTATPNFDGLSISNTLFSPDGDGVSENTVFTIESNEPVKVKMRVNTRSSERFRVIEDDQFSTSFQLTWDGKSDQLSVIDGEYDVSVEIEDRAGNVRLSDVQQLVVHRNRDGISNVAMSSTFIRSESNWSLSFDVSDKGSIFGRVLTVQDEPLATLSPISNVEVGQNSIHWNGKNDLGRVVADGTYKIVLEYTDFRGIKSKTPLELLVEVDNTSPLLSESGFSSNS
ncbi:hypothetical protein DID80_05295, partial [Candidatus Marinamargulisbacteria bacterium SCGC AAA071-K20]